MQLEWRHKRQKAGLKAKESVKNYAEKETVKLEQNISHALDLAGMKENSIHEMGNNFLRWTGELSFNESTDITFISVIFFN